MCCVKIEPFSQNGGPKDYPIPTGIGLSKNHLSIFSDRTIFRNSALTTIGSWSLRTEQRRLSFEEKLKLQI